MNETNSKLGKNIKYLRKAYGETQEDLQLVIGLLSKSTISNYEKGLQLPERDTLFKIAAHYRLTVDELTHGDFSEFNIMSIPFDDTSKMKNILEKLLPIVYTENSFSDPLFKKGYEAHMRIYNNMKAQKYSDDFDDRDFDICIESYINSYETNDTLESAANYLWWIFYIDMMMKDIQIFEGVEKLQRNQIKKDKFVQNYLLHNPDDEYIDEDKLAQKEEWHDVIEESEKGIIKMLRKLKASPQWSDLSDYYSALRYSLGMVDNKLSDNMNRAVGGEMLSAIAVLGNKYARSLRRAYRDFVKP